MHLILLGPPGAGKGTQGDLLAETLGLSKIATGDMLRDAVRNGTELGKQAQRFMDAGELVPDEVLLGLVGEAVQSPSASSGVIFDGYPRNPAQAASLGQMLDRIGISLDAVVVLEVPAETIVRRMSGRRTDPETGRVYHLEHNPPPPEVADRCVQRPDDREETVRHRLDVYERNTAPLVRFYEEESGVAVHRVDGAKPIEEVQQAILRKLGR